MPAKKSTKEKEVPVKKVNVVEINAATKLLRKLVQRRAEIPLNSAGQVELNREIEAAKQRLRELRG